MSITIVLLIITGGVSYFSFQNPSLLDKLLLNPVKVSRYNEYYRFVTSGFVHADFGHLFFNMFSLYFVGEAVERVLGAIFGPIGQFYFLALYILGIIVSDIPSFLKNRTNSNYNSLGASGGVSAVMFAFVLLAPLQEICLYGFICMPGFIFGGLYIAYSFYESRRGAGFINHDAHLYGALFGLLFMAILLPGAIPNFFEQISTYRLF
ncbi:MAG: rhomboid family intramembrane serine protease [Runella slithyformis]|jgi:membrane associated rhomboid family serine protease|nr:MAG: rhomboid family intramembrane serine protease [Runella slithyformis]TAE91180.1 MAG: rhomboid family intramembrane serine protease [Runella slithyformis]TAF28424.1 MAG: rhomboid family intramembrane serine protease [Runella slithyformis]TAF47043.1 MAG: rhomboid family intramembrane serine protease [Runella slithyformis]TAF82004.1 MAG: rhomboid family intramembrane serine protease [Runella slithyformis]